MEQWFCSIIFIVLSAPVHEKWSSRSQVRSRGSPAQKLALGNLAVELFLWSVFDFDYLSIDLAAMDVQLLWLLVTGFNPSLEIIQHLPNGSSQWSFMWTLLSFLCAVQCTQLTMHLAILWLCWAISGSSHCSLALSMKLSATVCLTCLHHVTITWCKQAVNCFSSKTFLLAGLSGFAVCFLQKVGLQARLFPLSTCLCQISDNHWHDRAEGREGH